MWFPTEPSADEPVCGWPVPRSKLRSSLGGRGAPSSRKAHDWNNVTAPATIAEAELVPEY